MFTILNINELIDIIEKLIIFINSAKKHIADGE